MFFQQQFSHQNFHRHFEQFNQQQNQQQKQLEHIKHNSIIIKCTILEQIKTEKPHEKIKSLLILKIIDDIPNSRMER